MDNKGIPRSHHAGFEPPVSHAPQNGRRPQRKPTKKSQNVLCDNRAHHVPNNHEHLPLFNNRSLSMLSTMHHLNPHRKVAMSPEILREAEEQVTSLRKTVKQLQDQLEKTSREKARIHRFLSDLLYTLNARGYESVQDHEGTVVDLNKCKGESYLELKGRDLKQRVTVRRQGGQELLMKAVIGNQERAIQSLIYKLDSIGRDMILGNRLCIEDTESSINHAHESAKVASLESEVLQLVNMIEGACQRCPEMYSALRDHYYLNEVHDGSELSPRNPVIHNLLRKCEQIAGEAQSRQLVDMLIEGNRQRPKSQQSSASASGGSSTNPSPPSTGKPIKSRPSSKQKSVQPGSRTPRPVAPTAEVGPLSSNNNGPTWPQSEFLTAPTHSLAPPPREAGSSQSDDCLKPLNGGNRLENFKPKGPSFRFSRPPIPPSSSSGHTNNENSNPSGEAPSYGGQGGSPTTQSSMECGAPGRTVCPYCHRRFGLEESISEIKSHIEMHIFAGDSALL